MLAAKIRRLIFPLLLLTFAAVMMLTISSQPASAATTTSSNNGLQHQDHAAGAKNVIQLTDGLEFLALGAAIMVILISCILWAMGSKGQNPGQELTGKKGIILGVVAAFFIGATPPVLGFFDLTSRSTDDAGNITTSVNDSQNTGGGCTLIQTHDGTGGC